MEPSDTNLLKFHIAKQSYLLIQNLKVVPDLALF